MCSPKGKARPDRAAGVKRVDNRPPEKKIEATQKKAAKAREAYAAEKKGAVRPYRLVRGQAAEAGHPDASSYRTDPADVSAPTLDAVPMDIEQPRDSSEKAKDTFTTNLGNSRAEESAALRAFNTYTGVMENEHTTMGAFNTYTGVEEEQLGRNDADLGSKQEAPPQQAPRSNKTVWSGNPAWSDELVPDEEALDDRRSAVVTDRETVNCVNRVDKSDGVGWAEHLNEYIDPVEAAPRSPRRKRKAKAARGKRDAAGSSGYESEGELDRAASEAAQATTMGVMSPASYRVIVERLSPRTSKRLRIGDTAVELARDLRGDD